MFFYQILSDFIFFRSGTVIISSIDYGLFVVRPDYVAMETAAAAIRAGSGAMTLQGTQERSQEAEVMETACEPKSEIKPCKQHC